MLFLLPKILPVNKMYEYCILIIMYKFHICVLPQAFQCIFKRKPEPLDAQTRQFNQLYGDRHKSQFVFKSIQNYECCVME